MSSELTGVPAVDVTRGATVESTHAVAACVCDARGRVLHALGAVDAFVYLRSAAKPFIAAAVVRSGAVARFGFTTAEIALMCGSHNGEPLHVATAAAMLAKIGATEDDLACGAPEGGTQLSNNCSGKHAGILALARAIDAPLAGYLDREHPAQRAVLAFCERIFGERFPAERLGVDGCGIPNFTTTLASAARTFARFARIEGFEADDAAALTLVRDAMIAEPWFVGGTGRFDTDLMRVAGGSIAAKAGAEGVQAIALLDSGVGIVLKVIDGARRATSPAAMALLVRSGALDAERLAALAVHAVVPVRNVAGRVVGEVRARAGL